jgi:hypothetical protein
VQWAGGAQGPCAGRGRRRCLRAPARRCCCPPAQLDWRLQPQAASHWPVGGALVGDAAGGAALLLALPDGWVLWRCAGADARSGLPLQWSLLSASAGSRAGSPAGSGTPPGPGKPRVRFAAEQDRLQRDQAQQQGRQEGGQPAGAAHVFAGGTILAASGARSSGDGGAAVSRAAHLVLWDSACRVSHITVSPAGQQQEQQVWSCAPELGPVAPPPGAQVPFAVAAGRRGVVLAPREAGPAGCGPCLLHLSLQAQQAQAGACAGAAAAGQPQPQLRLRSSSWSRVWGVCQPPPAAAAAGAAVAAPPPSASAEGPASLACTSSSSSTVAAARPSSSSSDATCAGGGWEPLGLPAPPPAAPAHPPEQQQVTRLSLLGGSQPGSGTCVLATTRCGELWLHRLGAYCAPGHAQAAHQQRPGVRGPGSQAGVPPPRTPCSPFSPGTAAAAFPGPAAASVLCAGHLAEVTCALEAACTVPLGCCRRPPAFEQPREEAHPSTQPPWQVLRHQQTVDGRRSSTPAAAAAAELPLPPAQQQQQQQQQQHRLARAASAESPLPQLLTTQLGTGPPSQQGDVGSPGSVGSSSLAGSLAGSQAGSLLMQLNGFTTQEAAVLESFVEAQGSLSRTSSLPPKAGSPAGSRAGISSRHSLSSVPELPSPQQQQQQPLPPLEQLSEGGSSFSHGQPPHQQQHQHPLVPAAEEQEQELEEGDGALPQRVTSQRRLSWALAMCPPCCSQAGVCAEAGSCLRPSQVLITGAADGSVRVWSLGRRTAGRPLLASFPHSSPVRRLLLPPPGCGPHGAPAFWRSCVLSVAEDGSVALTSLAAGGLVRLLRGFPFGQPAEVYWDVGRWACCLPPAASPAPHRARPRPCVAVELWLQPCSVTATQMKPALSVCLVRPVGAARCAPPAAAHWADRAGTNGCRAASPAAGAWSAAAAQRPAAAGTCWCGTSTRASWTAMSAPQMPRS